MRIDRTTTARQLVDYYAHPFSAQTRASMGADIEKLISIAADEENVRRYNERLQKQSKDPSQNWSLASWDKEMLENIADRLPAKAKAGLMRLSHSDLKQLLKDYEKPIFDELREYLEGEIVDRADNYRIDFEFFMKEIDKKPISQAKTLQLLNQQKIYLARAEKILDALKADYKVLEADENSF